MPNVAAHTNRKKQKIYKNNASPSDRKRREDNERERERISSRRYSMNRRRMNNSGRIRRSRTRSNKSNPPFKLICINVYI